MRGETNNYEQKKKFHAMLRDIAQQLEWDGAKRDEKEWKFIVLAGAYGQEFVTNPLYDASDPESKPYIVNNKRRTRELPMSGDNSMANLITQLYAFGNERGVKWTDPKEVAERAAWEREAERAAA